MKHAQALKPLAIVSSLALGAGIVWYQASLMRAVPTAAPAAETVLEGESESLPVEDTQLDAQLDAAPSTAPSEAPGTSYFSTSKSLTLRPVHSAPPVVLPDGAPGPDGAGASEAQATPIQDPAAAPPHFFGTSKSLQPIIPVRGGIFDFIPWDPSESSDEPTQQPADETDE